MMERAVVLARGSGIDIGDLPREVALPGPAAATPAPPGDAQGSDDLAMQPQVDALEQRLIQAALQRSGDNKSLAARLLEISERSLWYKIKKYGL